MQQDVRLALDTMRGTVEELEGMPEALLILGKPLAAEPVRRVLAANRRAIALLEQAQP